MGGATCCESAIPEKGSLLGVHSPLSAQTADAILSRLFDQFAIDLILFAEEAQEQGVVCQEGGFPGNAA